MRKKARTKRLNSILTPLSGARTPTKFHLGCTVVCYHEWPRATFSAVRYGSLLAVRQPNRVCAQQKCQRDMVSLIRDLMSWLSISPHVFLFLPVCGLRSGMLWVACDCIATYPARQNHMVQQEAAVVLFNIALTGAIAPGRACLQHLSTISRCDDI